MNSAISSVVKFIAQMAELQIRGGIEDSRKIIFLISN